MSDDTATFVGSYGLDPKDYGLTPQVSPAPAAGGTDISGGYHITKPPPPLPNESDASLLARAALAEGGASSEGQQAVIRALLERQKNSGKSVSTLLTEPGQIQTYWNGRLQGVDTTTPAFQSALKFAQTATPSPGIDSWGSPAGIKAQGFGKMPFDPATGVSIGGQLFGNGHYGSANADDAAAFVGAHGLDPLKYGPTAADAASVPPKTDPALDAAAAATARYQMEQAAQSGRAQWPIFDPANGVLRNRDGSIAAVRKADGSFAYAQPQISPSGGTGITIDVQAQPEVVNAWLASHPLDPANRPAAYGQTGTLPGPYGRAAVGAGQGLANVGNSLLGGETALAGVPGGNLLLAAGGQPQWLDPAYVAAQKAELARGVLNRNANDINYQNSGAYGVGKFVGEAAPTVPLMLATEGMGAAGLRALGAEDLFAPTGMSWATRLPAQLATSAGRGAVYGGEGAALTSAGSSAPLSEQIKQGAEAGAVLNPLLGGVARVGGAVGKLASPLLAPLSDAGRAKIVDQNLLALTGGPVEGDMTEYVPGSRPTLAQATQNPNLAVLERTMRANPQTGAANVAADLAKANETARDEYVSSLVADRPTVDALKAERDADTSTLREAAFAHKAPTDPSSVVQLIDGILASPAGQRDAVVKALTKVRGKLVQDVDLGAGKTVAQLQTDPEQLYGVRQSVDDLLSPLSEDKDARLAKSQLMQVKGALDGVIEQGAPGFRNYLSAYEAQSRPIEALEYLQSLNLRDMRGNLTLGNVNRAVTRMEADRASPGLDPAKSLSDDQVSALYNLRDDLRRADLTVPLGRAARAPIVTGNLNNQGLADAVTSPLAIGLIGAASHHPFGAVAVNAGKIAMARQQGKIANLLVDRLFNPDAESAPLNQAPMVPSFNPLAAGLRAGWKAIPAFAGINAGKNPLAAPAAP